MQLKSRLVPYHVNVNQILEWNVAGQKEGRDPDLQQGFSPLSREQECHHFSLILQ